PGRGIRADADVLRPFVGPQSETRGGPRGSWRRRCTRRGRTGCARVRRRLARLRANMGKKTRERALAENEAKAVARMLRVSPQKLNLVAQLIRGKKVATALADLEFSRKRIARDVRKCLESAIANAENNHDPDVRSEQRRVGKQ